VFEIQFLSASFNSTLMANLPIGPAIATTPEQPQTGVSLGWASAAAAGGGRLFSHEFGG